MHVDDQQLLESVALRRDRLAAAAFQGPGRGRRAYRDNLKAFMTGIIVAAVIATGCVATSFVSSLLSKEQAKQQQQQQQIQAPSSPQRESEKP